jgi:serine/threonine-protein phosphatase 2A regulatory subunit B
MCQSGNEQFLLSTDESQTFLWDIERPDRPYLLCDLGITSSKGDDRETITCCKMHPQSDSIFLYGMSKGSLQVADMRVSASSEDNSTCYKLTNSNPKNYLLNLISNISSATFTNNGKYIVTRDYLSVKVWDVCNSKKPVSCVILNEGLKSKLCEMVENEAIYDEFGVAVRQGNSILTGSYNNCFHLMDFEGNNTQYELSYKKATVCRSMAKPTPITKMDYDRKVLASSFNPARNVLAVASLNCFFTYSL